MIDPRNPIPVGESVDIVLMNNEKIDELKVAAVTTTLLITSKPGHHDFTEYTAYPVSNIKSIWWVDLA